MKQNISVGVLFITIGGLLLFTTIFKSNRLLRSRKTRNFVNNTDIIAARILAGIVGTILLVFGIVLLLK